MADNIFGATAIPSQDFDGGWHTFGALAEVSGDSNLVGGRAFFPNSTPANFLWVVFKVSDESIIAQVDLAALAGTSTAAWNDFTSADFDTPGDVTLDPAEQYIPAVVTNGDFRFLDAGVSYPYGAGIVTASQGRFHNGGSGAVFPASTSSSVVFGADMLVEAGGTDATATPAAVSATTTLGAPAISTGSTVSPAAVAATTTVPSPVLSTGTTATPSVITATTTVAAVSVATGSTVAPAAVAASVTFPATAVTTGANLFTSITAGKPHGRWHVGTPHGRWHVRPPRGE